MIIAGAPSMVEPGQSEIVDFKWGKKKGKGGKKKDVQFYESFTWDSVDYSLYDSVYMFDETGVEPHIGILIKIWELPNGSKRVKTLWFFRPCEISKFIGDAKFVENELLLAAGEGVGLTNINPLEAIAGKCNVVSTSRDGRIQVTSNNVFQGADFVFYRTFDVAHRTILEHSDGIIAGIDVKFLFSRMHSQESCTIQKLDSNEKGFKEISVAIDETNKIDVYGNDVVMHKTSASSQTPHLGEQTPKIQHADGGKLVVTARPNETNERIGFETTKSSSKENVAIKHPRVALVADNPQKPTSGSGVDRVYHRKHASMTNDLTSSKFKDKIGSSSKENCSGASHEKNDRIKERSEKVTHDLSSGDAKVVARGTKHERDSQGFDGGSSKKPKLDENPSTFVGRVTLKPSLEQASKKGLNSGNIPLRLEPPKKPKLDEKLYTLARHKTSKPSLEKASNKGLNVGNNPQRPEVDKSKWFKLPWDERLRMEHERGKVILLQNLDPSFSSSEVEEVIQKAFKLSCSAKMIQRTAFSSPNYGQAFAIFNTRQVAEMVVTKLDKGCLMLPNGRPLVATFSTPCFPTAPKTLRGHLVIDKRKHQMQREMKEAVSTSHCSQPNTIEYDMAIEWRLLAERSDRECKSLHELQGNELRNLKAALKFK